MGQFSHLQHNYVENEDNNYAREFRKKQYKLNYTSEMQIFNPLYFKVLGSEYSAIYCM